MELNDYLRILRKRWLVIVVMTLVGLATAATATLLTTPRYTASTQVFVFVPSSGTVGELAQGGNFAQSQVRSYVEAVSTPRVLDDVVRELNLEETATELASSVTAEAPLNTVNISIAVTRDSPVEAAEIANATTASFRTVIDDITAGQVSVSVLREATVPDSPVSPNRSLNLALGLLVGLAVGVGLAILREVLDTRIHGQRDIEAITSAAVIGGVSFSPDAVKRPLIVQDDPRSPRAEAFRVIRTNLQFLDIEPGARSFVVTSSIPAEGKSTTAANLAITIAESGARVLLVDADLRRPKVAEYLGLEGAVGLSDVLINRVSIHEVIQPWGRNRMAVLPAGSIPPNPSELLGSRAMSDLLHTLEREFDVIIIDMPPLLPVTDAALVSKMVRGALVVAAAGRTDRAEFKAAVTSLENVGAKVSGVILTMLPTKGPDAYRFGQYGYAYASVDQQAAQPTRRKRKARASAR